jgi:hypothetical protein
MLKITITFIVSVIIFITLTPHITLGSLDIVSACVSAKISSTDKLFSVLVDAAFTQQTKSE